MLTLVIIGEREGAVSKVTENLPESDVAPTIAALAALLEALRLRSEKVLPVHPAPVAAQEEAPAGDRNSDDASEDCPATD